MPSPLFHTRFFSLAAVAVAILMVAEGSPAFAATITWGSAQNITGDSDVITTGSLVYAYNFGGPSVTSATVNGVTFAPFGIPFEVTSGTAGNVTISESPDFLYPLVFTTGSAPFSTLTSSYQNLLAPSVFAGNIAQITLQLGGLTLGTQYDFQWWSNVSAAGVFGSTVATAVNTISLQTTPQPYSAGVLGQYAVGRFTASGSSQSIFFDGVGGSPVINGFQLRTAAAPGPTDLIWNTTTGTWNTTNTVWTTGTGGTLAFTNGDSVTFSGTGGGTVTLSGTIQPSSITVSATSGTYTFVSSAGNLLTGTTGLDKSGGGTLVLSGSNAFSGPTTVDGGVLLVNGVLSSTTTTVSAILGGSGNVSGVVQMAAGGTLAPGETIGGTGLLTMNSLSGTNYTIAMQITGTGVSQYDQIVTTGNLAYSGTLNLQMSGGAYTAGDTFNLFDFTTTSGTLPGIDMTGSTDGWQNLTWFAPGQAGVGTYDYGDGVWQSSWAIVDGQPRKLLLNQGTGLITVVPEPSILVMVGGALACFAGLRRRRRAGQA